MFHTKELEYLCNLPPLGVAERVECKLANITLTNEAITYEVMAALQDIEQNIDNRTLAAWATFNVALVQYTELPRRSKYLSYLFSMMAGETDSAAWSTIRGRFYEMMHGAFSYAGEYSPNPNDIKYLTMTFRVLDHFLYCSYKGLPFPHEHLSTID